MLKKLLLYSFLAFGFAYAQPSNDECTNAQRLCANQPLQGTTTGATSTAAEEDNFCSVYTATVWYLFTTNATGGNVTVSFTNMSFNTDPTYGQNIDAIILEAASPCSGAYTPRSICEFQGADFNMTSAVALAPNTTYYVMVNGNQFGGGATMSAECDYTIDISGPAMDATFPTASISAATTTICQGEDVPVDVTITDCADTASFEWYYDNTLISSGPTSDFSTTMLSDSAYLKLIINCGDLCVYSDTTDSIFFEVTAIAADAGPDKFILEGDVVGLEGSGDGNPEWTPATTLTDGFIFNPVANPTFTTTYYLTVTNGSCVATDSVNVFVGELVTIYSGFTPNGDDTNDKWVIKNSSQYPDMEVTVYDRSGQRVFQTTGYSTPDKWWDGTYKGKPLPVSTYYYVVDLKIGDEGVFKGPVNIIR